MDHTGRIATPIDPRARRLLFTPAESWVAELRLIAEVDRAHVTMLASRELIPRAEAIQLLRAIDRLDADNFELLHTRASTRGLYLLYEDHLIASEGAAVGGLLQTARSRNDLNATTFKLALRRPFARVLLALLRLQADLLARARTFAAILMPTYTHGQPATPGTLGHYLAGVAQALGRDIQGLLDAARDLDRSPLGAGAAGGTSVPIDTQRTAEWLGFRGAPLHAIDAVASRDLGSRVLAASAIAGTTLSRLAADLCQWTRADCALLALPDSLVGSSSAMPQKRNPFLLEHVLGRVTTGLGAFTSALAATHGTPFTNAIAVGTEAYRPMWRALDDCTDSATLLRLVVLGARPRRRAMQRWTVEGLTVSQALAHDIAARNDLDFRSAHRLVGECIRAVLATRRRPRLHDLAVALRQRGLRCSREALSPRAIVEASRWGGGPAPEAMTACLEATRAGWRAHRAELREMRRRWRGGARALARAVRALCREDAENRVTLHDRSAQRYDDAAVRSAPPRDGVGAGR